MWPSRSTPRACWASMQPPIPVLQLNTDRAPRPVATTAPWSTSAAGWDGLLAPAPTLGSTARSRRQCYRQASGRPCRRLPGST